MKCNFDGIQFDSRDRFASIEFFIIFFFVGERWYCGSTRVRSNAGIFYRINLAGHANNTRFWRKHTALGKMWKTRLYISRPLNTRTWKIHRNAGTAYTHPSAYMGRRHTDDAKIKKASRLSSKLITLSTWRFASRKRALLVWYTEG